MEIQTKRLLIRPWLESDLNHFIMMATDIGYNCFAPPGHFMVKDSDEALAKIQQRIQLYNSHRIGKFPIFDIATSEFLGTCGFDFDTIERERDLELGYRLLLKNWGKGFALEAAVAMVKYAFDELQKDKVFAFALQKNSASIKVLRHLGLKYQSKFQHGGLPHSLFSMDRELFSNTLKIPSYLEAKAASRYKRFVILLTQKLGVVTTANQIAGHIHFLRDLEKEGKLELCGPFTNFGGGMVILKVATMDEAIKTAESDPFVTAEVRTFEIREWMLSCEQNNHLVRG